MSRTQIGAQVDDPSGDGRRLIVHHITRHGDAERLVCRVADQEEHYVAFVLREGRASGAIVGCPFVDTLIAEAAQWVAVERELEERRRAYARACEEELRSTRGGSRLAKAESERYPHAEGALRESSDEARLERARKEAGR